jgi:hypothetical protein
MKASSIWAAGLHRHRFFLMVSPAHCCHLARAAPIKLHGLSPQCSSNFSLNALANLPLYCGVAGKLAPFVKAGVKIRKDGVWPNHKSSKTCSSSFSVCLAPAK